MSIELMIAFFLIGTVVWCISLALLYHLQQFVMKKLGFKPKRNQTQNENILYVEDIYQKLFAKLSTSVKEVLNKKITEPEELERNDWSVRYMGISDANNTEEEALIKLAKRVTDLVETRDVKGSVALVKITEAYFNVYIAYLIFPTKQAKAFDKMGQ